MITRKSLYIDRDQGTTVDERAFGYVGTNATTNYRGWFFTWPGRNVRITDEEEIGEVLATLDLDSENPCSPVVPRRFAEYVLTAYLRRVLAE